MPNTDPRFSWYFSKVSRNSSCSLACSSGDSWVLFGAMLRLSHSPETCRVCVARHARIGRCVKHNGGRLGGCASRSVAMMDEHQNAHEQLLTSRRGFLALAHRHVSARPRLPQSSTLFQSPTPQSSWTFTEACCIACRSRWKLIDT